MRRSRRATSWSATLCRCRCNLRRLRPRAGRVAVVLGRMPRAKPVLWCNRSGARHQQRGRGTSTRGKPGARAEAPAVPQPDRLAAPRARSHAEHAGPAAADRLRRPDSSEKGLENCSRPPAACTAIDFTAVAAGVDRPVSIPQAGRRGLFAALQQAYSGKLDGALPSSADFDAAELARRTASWMSLLSEPRRKGRGPELAPFRGDGRGSGAVVSQLECYRDLIVVWRKWLHLRPRRARGGCHAGGDPRDLLADAPRRHAVRRRAQESAPPFRLRETSRLLLDRFAQLTGAAAVPISIASP